MSRLFDKEQHDSIFNKSKLISKEELSPGLNEKRQKGL